ncbi:hypothetical protein OH77DRAFT_1569950 [Trametes cingulata]|nr:hypothetical protein OH77DRAFT_1569950 [Trametes cingulata]
MAAERTPHKTRGQQPPQQPQQGANAQGQGGVANPATQLFFAVATDPAAVSAFQLSADERIDQLERELFNLRQGRARFDGVEVPRRKPNPSRSRGSSQERRDAPPHLPASSSNNPFRVQQRAEPVQAPPTSRERTEGPSRLVPAGGRPEQAKRPEPGAAPTVPAQDTTVEAAKKPTPAKEGPPRPPTPVNAPQPERAVEHPFAKAKDATYTPPRARNFGAPPAKPKDGEREAAYRTQAPVHDVKFAEEIFARSMKTPVITLSPEELLSIAPEVRAKYREAVTPRRVPNVRSVAFASIEEVTDEDDDDGSEHFLASVSCSGEPLEPGAYVLPDPYEVYLRDVAADREPSPLTVAKESYALRSIVGLVDNKEYVEAIIDPGCMVIAMSESVCHALGMWYDPGVQLRMISANGEVDSSLGLVRNVPFCVADIVLYLQVHVIRHAAYDMLLGRPFDVLTKSVVKNFANEDQTITIRCPNTGQVATIPTIPRGQARFREGAATPASRSVDRRTD